ncbi:MAG: hypothetical protein R3B11_02985 [Nitrospira sp.]|nr:hypothetical protein [Nitrospira sp.]MDR4474955.1 hypothetical protein [Nitrospira sp.]
MARQRHGKPRRVLPRSRHGTRPAHFLLGREGTGFGLSAYREVLRQARLSENSETNDMIQRVGQRIAKAANKPE